jgi:hypothetical protein
MLRFAFKLLLQLYHDGHPLEASSDPVPNWLRRCVQSDRKLKEFESQLFAASRLLKSQSQQEIENVTFGREFETPSAFFVPGRKAAIDSDDAPGKFWLVKGLRGASIAGAMLLLLLLARLVINPTKYKNREPIRTATPSSIYNNEDVNRLMHATWSVSKRMANQWKTKSDTIASRLSEVDNLISQEPVRLGKDGLHFLTHRVPVSAIRMVYPAEE